MSKDNDRLPQQVDDKTDDPAQGPSDLHQSLGVCIAQLTSGSPDVGTVLQRTVDLVCQLLPHANGASVTVLDDRHLPTTAVSTGDWVEELDAIQYRTQQGPCLEAAITAAPIVGSNDLPSSSHWPAFGPRASELGVCALLAAGISGRPHPEDPQRPAGALNVYSRCGTEFTSEDRDQILLIASIAGVAVRLARAQEHNENLRQALSSRDVIGQAKGILMERHALSEDQAFAMLRQSSNRLNRKLRDLAADVVASPQKSSR